MIGMAASRRATDLLCRFPAGTRKLVQNGPKAPAWRGLQGPDPPDGNKKAAHVPLHSAMNFQIDCFRSGDADLRSGAQRLGDFLCEIGLNDILFALGGNLVVARQKSQTKRGMKERFRVLHHLLDSLFHASPHLVACPEVL
jgi:hypothetical protein